MDNESRPPHERANSLYLLAAAVAALGVFPYLVGEAEVTYGHHPWENGWVRFAFGVWVLAVLVLMWGIWLNGSQSGRAWRARRAERRRAAAKQTVRLLEQRVIAAMRANEEAKQEARRRHWQLHVKWGLSAGNPALLLHLSHPSDADPSTFEGKTARCQFSKSARVFSSPELTFAKGLGGFIPCFPQEFGGDELPGPGEYVVWWESVVLLEDTGNRFQHEKFRIDQTNTLHFRGEVLGRPYYP